MFRKERNVWYLEIIIKETPEDRGGGVSTLRDAIKRYPPTFSCGALRQLLGPHILRAPNNNRGRDAISWALMLLQVDTLMYKDYGVIGTSYRIRCSLYQIFLCLEFSDLLCA